MCFTSDGDCLENEKTFVRVAYSPIDDRRLPMKQNRPVFIGIDGGGTRSLVVAIDRDGLVLAAAEAGSLNFFGAGLTEARRNLSRLVKSVERQLPAKTRVRRAVVGCAAFFTEATEEEKKTLCGGILPLARTRVISDCQTACHGATLGRPGVVVIAGTGSIVLAQNKTGEPHRVGGWGHILGDEGSAYWIAVESVKAAIATHERPGKKTTLGNQIRDWFRVKRLTELVPIIYQPRFTKEKFAALAGFIAANGGLNDEVFRQICRRAGQMLAAQALAAAREVGLKLKPLPVYPIGGVIEQNALVHDSFIAALKRAQSIQLCPPQLPPVLGAAALALSDAGISLTPTRAKRMAASYRRASRAAVEIS